MNLQWSDWSGWLPFTQESCGRIPEKKGIYEVRADFKIKRLNGDSEILAIGRATRSNLRARISAEICNPARFMNRCKKWLVRNNHKLGFRWYVAADAKEAELREALRHWEYENEHWEIPPGNDRLEKAPIMKELAKKMNVVDANNLNNLLVKYHTVEKVAEYLDMPSFVIENLMVYLYI